MPGRFIMWVESLFLERSHHYKERFVMKVLVFGRKVSEQGDFAKEFHPPIKS